MSLVSYNTGQIVTTNSGEEVLLTNTSDPTCLIGIGPDGNEVRIKRSEVSNPVFETYQKRYAQLETELNDVQIQYAQACENSEELLETIRFHSYEKNKILTNAGTVSKFNLGSEDRPTFDNHYELYWAGRFDLAASQNDEFRLTRSGADIQMQMANYRSAFGI